MNQAKTNLPDLIALEDEKQVITRLEQVCSKAKNLEQYCREHHIYKIVESVRRQISTLALTA